MALQRRIPRSMASPSRNRLRSRFACALVAVAVMAALLLPAMAAASGQAHRSKERSGKHGKAVGGLPFTGVDLVALAAVAVSLTSTGLALRLLTTEDRGPA
jgi:hypothetical protein